MEWRRLELIYGTTLVLSVTDSQHMQWAPGRCYTCTQQMAALFCIKWWHGHHPESEMSYQKSD